LSPYGCSQKETPPKSECCSTPVCLVKDFLENNPVTTLDHPTDFLVFAPVDFYLLPKLKSTLQGKSFCDATNIIKNSTEELKRLSQYGFQ
jgi:hypothetical protein